jgi:hypothetical protein
MQIKPSTHFTLFLAPNYRCRHGFHVCPQRLQLVAPRIALVGSACRDRLQHNLGGNFSDGSLNATKDEAAGRSCGGGREEKRGVWLFMGPGMIGLYLIHCVFLGWPYT